MNSPRTNPSEGVSRTGLEVAVVGLAGRFPGGGDVARFWASIVAKQESISRFTLQELRDEGIPEALLSSAGYVPAAGIVANKEYFDPQFFGYSPNEARLMDPQLRIFLECVWEALEHAGCDPLRFGGKIGLYAGCSPNLGWELLVRDSELRDEVGDYSASLNELMDELGASAERTLMVGDTTHDVQMAQNAKVDVVAVGHGAHTPQQLQELNPLALVKDFAELKMWFKANA